MVYIHEPCLEEYKEKIYKEIGLIQDTWQLKQIERFVRNIQKGNA